MTGTRAIERVRGHRPWPYPTGPWIMFQSWRRVLFAHWPVPMAALRPLVPPRLTLETFDGTAWVGLVPFCLTDLRPRFLPPFPGVSTFPEMNLRTYVRVDDKPGIYFFSLDAASRLAVAAARTFYRLPYFHAEMSMERRNGWVRYRSRRIDSRGPAGAGGDGVGRATGEGGTEGPAPGGAESEALGGAEGEAPGDEGAAKGSAVDTSGNGIGPREGAEFVGCYRPEGSIRNAPSGSLEHFLVERYALYVVLRNGKVLRGDIHHPPWQLQRAEAVVERNTVPAAHGITLSDRGPLLHYVERQDVLIWPPRLVG